MAGTRCLKEGLYDCLQEEIRSRLVSGIITIQWMVPSLEMTHLLFAKVKDRGERSLSYAVFSQLNPKRLLFSTANDEKEPIKGQMLFALNKKEKPDYYSYVKKYLK